MNGQGALLQFGRALTDRTVTHKPHSAQFPVPLVLSWPRTPGFAFDVLPAAIFGPLRYPKLYARSILRAAGNTLQGSEAIRTESSPRQHIFSGRAGSPRLLAYPKPTP